jgi:SAM-dependent methyltransferase
LNTYGGLHAAHYDLVYADKPYDREAAFVAREIAREIGEGPWKLIDVACGTGRHALEFAALGHEVTGVDYSPDLLRLARANAGDRVRLLEQDMRRLDVDGGPFDAVTCLFDSIGYPQTNDGVLATLRGIRSLLAPGARMVAEFLHTPAMLRFSSPVGVKRWDLPGEGELLRISRTSLDEAHSLMHVDYELIELRGDGGWERHTERQENRFFGVEEMCALVSEAGLQVERFVPAYGDGEVTGETFHVMVVATA